MPIPINISGRQHLIESIGKNYDNKIVFMFTAKWCGPCKRIKSIIEGEWYKLYEKVTILYIDIDDINNEDILSDFDIQGVPMFVINKINEGKLEKLYTFNGADIMMLEKLLNK
jgi:thioredoxin 1